ncbi:RNA-directed DNA polymerase, eukaryota, partial [Tanacetum coccineum]
FLITGVIYNILNKENNNPFQASDPSHPPGFTPIVADANVEMDAGISINKPDHSVNSLNNGGISSHSGVKRSFNLKTGGSIMDVIENLVEIGQTMGYNMEGCKKNLEDIVSSHGDSQLNTKHKINFVAIQETKLESIDLFSIREIWGNLSFDFSVSPSVGYSGGIVCIWDPACFAKDNATISDNFVAVRGTWVSSATKLMIVSIYAPQDLTEKRALWDYISHIIGLWDGECIILGDFNEVRSEQERFGSNFNVSGANAFNHFISSSGLIDLPLEGYLYTCAIKSAKKMSKLDRFLISEGLLLVFPSLFAICLERHLSDHRPIIMREIAVDYGPSPFLEGDENSKFFHGIVNMKRSQLAIRGVLIDGDWIDEPSNVKNEFLSHFANRFASPSGPSIVVDNSTFKQLSNEQVVDLECDITYDEIKRAIFINAVREFFTTSKFPPGCNSSFIALIPKKQDAKFVKDFRPISLIGCFYKIIAKILANRLKMVISDLISEVQSAFVPNRQILDGPFILNEIISWCKSHKSKAMIFKVDFEKAFDSVRWDFLDGILSNFGFGSKWRGWIQSCLSSAMGSILVNGSPTSEFKFHRGLKQGDPLSPYLFILVMESLHLSFNNILNAGLFKGIRIDDTLTLSHLFYADDAIFIGKWERANGIGVSNDEVNAAANIIGCATFSSPFTYLGVKVGMSFSKRKSWDEVIVTSLYGNRLPIDGNVSGSVSAPWHCIIKELGSLSYKGINLLAQLKKKVGNGVHTLFWKDSWINGTPLNIIFPRVYALENRKDITVAEKLNDADLCTSFRRAPRGGVEEDQFVQFGELVGSISLSDAKDRWIWLLDSTGEFSVHSARIYIDSIMLPDVGPPTRWVKVVPNKINVFAWKVSLDKLPSRLNLSLRGIDIPSITCPICCLNGESCSHLFFACSFTRLIWRKIARWWDIDIMTFNVYMKTEFLV